MVMLAMGWQRLLALPRAGLDNEIGSSVLDVGEDTCGCI